MDPTATRTLGRTGVALTQLGFGAAPLGDLFTVVADADRDRHVGRGVGAGVRYFDTAPWYGRGQSEHRIGRGLYRRPRDQFVLSTKVGRVLRASRDLATSSTAGLWAGGLQFQHRFDYSYDGIMRAFEDSQQRLGLPRHRPAADPRPRLWHHHATEPGGRLPGAAASRRLARAAGAEAGRADPRHRRRHQRTRHDAALPRPDGRSTSSSSRMPYTLLDQDVLDSEFPRCDARGVGLVIGARVRLRHPGDRRGAGGEIPLRRRAADDRRQGGADRGGLRPAQRAARRRPRCSSRSAIPAVASVIPGGLAPGAGARNVGQLPRRRSRPISGRS